MAGAGKKTFASGEVLTASDVNGYLMDQAVMKFADSSARGSAIAAPSEGMVSYLDDTNKLEVYDGAAWAGVSNAHAVAAARGTFTTTSVPSAQDAAQVSTLTVTYPSGRFSQTPVVMATTQFVSGVTRSEHAVFSVYTNGTASVTFTVANHGPGTAIAGGGAFGTAAVEVLAIQMSAGSAIG